MMPRVIGIVIACVALMALGMLGYLFDRWSMRPRYAWDFTKGRSAASLGIPPRASPIDPFYNITNPGRVVARFDREHAFDGHVTLAIFSQNWPGTVDTIELFMDSQSAEGAYQTALQFAREWNLRTAPLEEWHRTVLSGEPLNERTIRNDIIPSCDVELLMTFDHEKPYRVMLQISWLSEDRQKHVTAASRPVWKPADAEQTDEAPH